MDVPSKVQGLSKIARVIIAPKGLITPCVVSLAFLILPRDFHFTLRFTLRFSSHFSSRFSSHFSSRFRYQHVGIQNAHENARKVQEKRKKIQNASPTRENVSILYYTLGKKRESVAFCTCFARVLHAFCSQTLPKRKPNA